MDDWPLEVWENEVNKKRRKDAWLGGDMRSNQGGNLGDA